ncbi:hypothetical protein [Nonomuraea bangladeshensis]|uniref:hypothetical protein n=1 Tax=Nonomuraea bangladeshensis TaxID=404385 RepID=UPI003CD06A5A
MGGNVHLPAPAGSPCRTGRGRAAIHYQTARFRLVPQLAKTLGVPTPAVAPAPNWRLGRARVRRRPRRAG